jgi:hypothetical protein
MAPRKTSASRRAAKTADANTDADNTASATPTADDESASTTRSARAKKTAAAATPGEIAAPRGDGVVRATALEYSKLQKAGKKGDNKTPAPRPQSFAAVIPYRDPKTGEIIEPPHASVVPIDRVSKKIAGFRIEKVVATRMGYYMHKRIREGEVFFMGLVGDGYLPSWVKVADAEDEDPKVARSRQVSQASSAEELLADIEDDAGTEPPMALGGLQRRAHSSSGDVL